MVNILEVMEKKRQRRMASKNKLTEKERMEKEQALVKQAMYDEIIWALQLQKDIAEQCGNTEDVEKYEKQILLEQEKKDGTHERRLKQKQKEEEEKVRQEKLAEERKKQKEIRKQEEIKRKKAPKNGKLTKNRTAYVLYMSLCRFMHILKIHLHRLRLF